MLNTICTKAAQALIKWESASGTPEKIAKLYNLAYNYISQALELAGNTNSDIVYKTISEKKLSLLVMQAKTA